MTKGRHTVPAFVLSFSYQYRFLFYIYRYCPIEIGFAHAEPVSSPACEALCMKRS